MHDRFFVYHMLHLKASTAKLASLRAFSHTPLHVFTCSCKSTRLTTCNSFDEVNWLIKKLAQRTGQTHKWETPSRISQWHPVPGDQDGGVTARHAGKKANSAVLFLNCNITQCNRKVEYVYNLTHSYKDITTLNHPNLSFLRNAVQQQYSFKVRNIFSANPG